MDSVIFGCIHKGYVVDVTSSKQNIGNNGINRIYFDPYGHCIILLLSLHAFLLSGQEASN